MSETGSNMKEGSEELRLKIYRTLCAESANNPNADSWARMLASRATGFGEMPERLGLAPRQFDKLMARHFPDTDPSPFLAGPSPDPEREQERQELRALIMTHCVEPGEEHEWFADALASGCMGGTHLWHDLGLWSRKDVTAIIEHNFPALKAKNDRDMKWKKFLYKQLCLQEGIYICRSPSCEVCDDYKNCFSPDQ
jgi:nitrogen fixation protein NifQ